MSAETKGILITIAIAIGVMAAVARSAKLQEWVLGVKPGTVA
jgi:hypothetical protein